MLATVVDVIIVNMKLLCSLWQKGIPGSSGSD